MGKILNMFREFSMNYIQGYQQLTDEQKDMFDRTYKKHLASMSIDKRKEYAEDTILKIKAGTEENILKVHFKNGDCFIYFSNYQWVRVPK